MENLLESVKLVIFVYVLAAIVSLAVAGIIKFIFIAIQKLKSRAGAEPGGEPERTA